MCKPEYLWTWAEGPCARVHGKAGATAVTGESGSAAPSLGSPQPVPKGPDSGGQATSGPTDQHTFPSTE